MRERQSLFSATGIPSLFLIFAVLMLVTLSLLGYGTSRQDLSASRFALEQTRAYYESCSAATDFYTDTVANLKAFRIQAEDTEKFYAMAAQYFDNVQEATWDPKKHTVQYLSSFSQTQSLLVTFLIEASQEKESSPVRILTWNTTVTSDWNPDTSQSVYKGEK